MTRMFTNSHDVLMRSAHLDSVLQIGRTSLFLMSLLKIIVWHNAAMLFAPRRFWGPCEPPSSAAGPGDVGEHCSSSAAARDLCGLPGRVAQPPGTASNAGKSPFRATGEPGCPSFRLPFLGQARKGNCPAGASPASNNPRAARHLTGTYTIINNSCLFVSFVAKRRI